MDQEISTFCAFTSATPEAAQRYLTLTDGDVEQAVELYFSNPDLGASAAPTSEQTTQEPRRHTGMDIDDAINVDEDDDDDLQEVGRQSATRTGPSVEDDEAMARRLQEEMYGAGGSGGGGADVDAEGIRAPMARTTETLVGPGSDWRDDPNEMNSAIAEQLMQREAMRRRRPAPGIFNQRDTPSIWGNDDASDPEDHRARLSRATGGASDQSSKSNHLAELFRPPFDLISNIPFATARDEGKAEEKWILVNVQDPSIFDCQILNRDVWKDQRIRDTIKEHFIFLQYNKDDPHAQEYINYYMNALRYSEDAFPHIGIVDPRTGEQVKTWSGSPSPKAADFVMDLHEFLDRYSLKMEKKNPVQTKRKESKKDVAEMTEDEMLQMAMQNSLSNGASTGPKGDDPDALTRPVNGKGKAPAHIAAAVEDLDDAPHGDGNSTDSPFARISSTNPHTEPPTSADPKTTTRIQFRYSGGRVVRRFLLSDPVLRIYEWLKASPLEGKEGNDFELIAMGKNLIEVLDTSIEEAGLRNASVMVEFIED